MRPKYTGHFEKLRQHASKIAPLFTHSEGVSFSPCVGRPHVQAFLANVHDHWQRDGGAGVSAGTAFAAARRAALLAEGGPVRGSAPVAIGQGVVGGRRLCLRTVAPGLCRDVLLLLAPREAKSREAEKAAARPGLHGTAALAGAGAGPVVCRRAQLQYRQRWRRAAAARAIAATATCPRFPTTPRRRLVRVHG